MTAQPGQATSIAQENAAQSLLLRSTATLLFSCIRTLRLNTRWNIVAPLLACAVLLLAATAHANERERGLSVDLSGEWAFKLDPMDVGTTEKWFNETVPFDRTIQVPGSWNAQGFGYESEKQLREYEDKRLEEQKELKNLGILGEHRESGRLFHVYPGPAWYRKKVTIPSHWKGKIPWLIFHGVHREATVWVNGKLAGQHRSYVTPLKMDVSEFAKPGDTMTIVARVDARHLPKLDPLMGCLDTCDFVYATWGGIHRPVTLEATDTVRLEDIFILPKLANGTAEIRLSIIGAPSGQMSLAVEIVDADATIVASVKEVVAPGQKEIVLNASIPNAKLWSPKTPYLYTARIQLLGGDQLKDAKDTRFGMREFKVDGAKFLLNGKPIFLRGYGDDCIFPNTICPPADKEEFRRRLSMARDYGFNYVRHHSWTPPKEYLEAADELGMMVQPEFPFAYRWHLPTTPELERSALEQWESVIRQNRNHPSIVTWSMGNELYGSFPLAPRMYEAAKRLDPSRPVLDTDGCRFDEKDRKTLDFLVVPFNEGESIGFQDGKYHFDTTIAKPVVGHEMGYFVTLHDLSQLDLFKSGLRPYWLTQTRDLARRHGAPGVYADWLAASYRLQAVCLKSNMEAARRSRLSGTSVWLFQDYPNCAEGVVDMFFRPKGVRAEEFRKYNSPTVLLFDAPRRNFWSGETVEVKFVTSRFEDDPSENATLRWFLKSNGITVAEGVQDKLSIRCGGTEKLPTIQLNIPKLARAERLTLTAELTDAHGTIDNSWNLWAFPKDLIVEQSAKILGVGSEAFRDQYPRAQVHAGGPIPAETEVVVTAKFDQHIRDYLSSGGHVLLLDPEPAFEIERTNFRLSSWDGGGPSGTIFDAQHPALRAMPTEGWCDLQFYSLIQGSKTVSLNSLPVTIAPIVRCIDRPNRLADRAYLFEATVGRGKLLVSSFNFRQSLASKDVSGIFLLDQLVRYSLGPDFKPDASLPLEALKNVTP